MSVALKPPPFPSMIFLGMIIGSPIAGLISDQLRRRKSPMIVGAILSLLTVIAITYIPSISVTSLMLLFLAMGLFTSAQVISYALIIESNPIAVTASATAIAATIIMSCGAIFQPLFGWIMDHFGHYHIEHGAHIYDASAYKDAILILPITFAIKHYHQFVIKRNLLQAF